MMLAAGEAPQSDIKRFLVTNKGVFVVALPLKYDSNEDFYHCHARIMATAIHLDDFQRLRIQI